MSATSIPFNPAATTNLAGLFITQAQGLVQGVFMDDPALRYELAGGVLKSTETLPMWGGVALEEIVSATGFSPLGNDIARAADQAHLTGFSVFNQNGAAINTPQSPVPLTLLGGQVNFFRLGSGARIVVAADPALIDLGGGIITAQVSWDYTNQKLVAYDSVAALPVKVLSVQASGCMTVSYNSGTGAATWTRSSNACAVIVI
jgi:hypothetical protein